MDLIKTIEEQQKKENALLFRVGDTVVVHFEIIEGKTKRIQKYEGVVISIKGEGVRKTFTVRKISYGVGVERVFPVHSPRVIKVELLKTGVVGYICYEALKCFGKQDYADVIALLVWVYIGFLFCFQIGSWYDSFMNSELIQLIERIF